MYSRFDIVLAAFAVHISLLRNGSIKRTMCLDVYTCVCVCVRDCQKALSRLAKLQISSWPQPSRDELLLLDVHYRSFIGVPTMEVVVDH